MMGRKEDDDTKPFLSAITSLMELMASGLLPKEWYAAVREGEIIALPKEGGNCKTGPLYPVSQTTRTVWRLTKHSSDCFG
jgi:hypothetical protein